MEKGGVIIGIKEGGVGLLIGKELDFGSDDE